MEKIDVKQQNRRFIFISSILVIVTFILAYYIADLLFYGKNSYEVYSKLKKQKIQLQTDIKKLQFENATLQKQYLELKNLEPEEL